MCELTIVIVLIVINVIVSSIPLTQESSIKEREWVCHLLSYFTGEIIGFTIFKAIVLNLNQVNEDTIKFLIYLVGYQISWIIEIVQHY